MVIQIDNLVKRYENHLALDHLNLEVNDGDIYGLLGPNGSGKTTVLYCIMSLLHYDRGHIKIFGEEMQPNANHIKSRIGLVMQEPAVFGELTVYDNIVYFCSLYIHDRNELQSLTQEVIKKLKLLPYMNCYPKRLNENTLHCLNVACGIVHKPELLILDEPLTGIDPQSKTTILNVLKEMNEHGTTILYSTHYMEEAEEICTKMSILNKGKILASGTKQELKNMISLGEKISIEIFSLTEEQLTDIRRIPNIYSAFYNNNVLEVKSAKGRNNLLHIMTYLTEHNIPMGNIFTELPTLNDVFLEMTGSTSVEEGEAYAKKMPKE